MSEKNIIKTSPSKEFFIGMLTRDISLIDAVTELIDNSIDAAKKMNNKNDFKGLSIFIETSKDHFKIVDNCGGIPIEVAREHAFTFGRHSDAPKTETEITGIFGIGMKRALFKMGKNFTVKSVSAKSSFLLQVDVMKWADENEPWEFTFTEFDEEDHDRENWGTEIIVTNLYEGIAADFNSEVFNNKLITIIKQRTSFEIQANLTIKINESFIEPIYVEIINNDTIKPIKKTFNITEVDIKIVAGISNKTDPAEAGWYLYCNNRLIVAADKTSLTTWGGDENIKYHNDYAAFRGLVFFNSMFPERLPWNTSKNGIDTSSNIFIRTREEMQIVFKAISSEIRLIKSQDEATRDEIEDNINSMENIPINIASINTTIVNNNVFNVLQRIKVTPNPNPLVRVLYKKPKLEVEKIKKFLDVTTNKEVGEKTFEYFWDSECDS